MKIYLSMAIAIVFFVLGMCFTAFLAREASREYLDIVEFKYMLKQESLAAESMRDGHLEMARFYYTNLVSISASMAGKSALFDRKPVWTLSFPFKAFILKRIKEQPEVAVGRDRLQGIYRAQLAAVLEALGDNDEASTQYHLAAKSLGVANTARVKELIKQLDSSTEH